MSFFECVLEKVLLIYKKASRSVLISRRTMSDHQSRVTNDSTNLTFNLLERDHEDKIPKSAHLILQGDSNFPLGVHSQYTHTTKKRVLIILCLQRRKAMKKATGTIFILCVLLFPTLSMATNVGGIIDTNTIWDLANSPYTITSDVQVAEGVSLTIEPGVIVNGENHKITVWGEVNAIGTDSSKMYI